MKSTILKQAVIGAVVALSSTVVNAQSLSFNFDYIAQANTNSALTPGASIASLGGQTVGSINFTDLSDLNLGDGKTGVRVTAKLFNLSQFGSTYGSNTIEFSFPGTGAGTGGTEYITTANSHRNISGNYSLTTGGDGGIEWDEHGSVGNGTVNTASSHRWGFFQQQYNIVLGTFTDGETIQFDFLNGDTLTGGPNAGQTFQGFSVANLVSVANQDGQQPNAYAWLRLQPLSGQAIPNSASNWFDPFESKTNGRLNFLALTPVPEPETYSMMLAGVGLMGFVATRRRKTA